MKISKKVIGSNVAYLEQLKKLQEKVDVKQTSKVLSHKIQEKVEISSKAKELQRLKRMLQEIPAVRKKKVAEIKEALRKGTYQINNKKVAEKVLKEGLLNIIKG
ncbi:MAG TPA: flagellar biosynthesis anti-sigma factor FlgM [Candidatus Desulfofervidus auxilii]|uniref:Negative regulator of flagellin synthesis n=1 Tax=Desulfofervidus auxilii TaxID=1621989 RepID=A0A7V0I9S4_DESA2|nr:flagellar biosynthesis anti-sigma factor FlgM [Candidatus Desulfofervidus auxilii]